MIEELKVQIDTNLNDCDSEMSQVSNSFKTGECYICLQFIVGKMMICPKGCAQAVSIRCKKTGVPCANRWSKSLNTSMQEPLRIWSRKRWRAECKGSARTTRWTSVITVSRARWASALTASLRSTLGTRKLLWRRFAPQSRARLIKRWKLSTRMSSSWSNRSTRSIKKSISLMSKLSTAAKRLIVLLCYWSPLIRAKWKRKRRNSKNGKKRKQKMV